MRLLLCDNINAHKWLGDLCTQVFDANMILALQSRLNDEDEDVRQAALNVVAFAANQGEITHVFLTVCSQVCRCSSHENIQYKHNLILTKYAY